MYMYIMNIGIYLIIIIMRTCNICITYIYICIYGTMHTYKSSPGTDKVLWSLVQYGAIRKGADPVRASI